MRSVQQRETSFPLPLLLQPARQIIAVRSAQSGIEQLILQPLHLRVHLTTPVVTSGLDSGVAPPVFRNAAALRP